MVNNQAKTLNQAILTALATYQRQICYRSRPNARYQSMSYGRFERLVFRLIDFFHRQGVTNGERVVIVFDNSPEWMAAFMACLLAGGVAVPLRPSLMANMLMFILRDCRAKLVILQNEDHVQAIQESEAAAAADTDRQTTTVCVGETPADMPTALSLREILIEDSAANEEIDEAELRRHALEISPDQAATIHYVTSETRRPKGAVFSHAARLTAITRIADWFPCDDDEVAFTLLSWSEVSSLTLSLYYFLSGVPNVLGEKIETVERDMHETSPTVMAATPFLLQRFYETGKAQLAEQPDSTRELFSWAVAQGKAYQAAGPAASKELRRVYHQVYSTFFTRFQGMLGGRLRRFYSTGASLSAGLEEFFTAIDLPVLNVYSLTEAGGFPAASRTEARSLGSCGRIMPGFEVEIAPDGEVLVRSQTRMEGYWQRPEETRQVLSGDGWLRSGDIGFLDAAGYLHITGRKPDVLVLSNGQKVAPAPIENVLIASPFIAQAIIYGDSRPYITALIIPDREAIAGHFQAIAGDDRTAAIPDPKAIEELLDFVIAEANERLDSWEQVQDYRLLDPPPIETDSGSNSAENGERQLATERFASQFEAMYPAMAYHDQDEITQVQVDPERLQILLQKERILDAWMSDAGIQFLLDLAQTKGIDPPSMVHICDTAATIAQMENEEKPLSTAIIVGDPVVIGDILPVSQISLRWSDHIRRMRRTLITLAKLVDGVVLGYVVDKHGYVRGIHKLEVDLAEPSNYLLGPQFRRHAAISEYSDSVVFFVPLGGQQVRVFANGQMVGRYTNGDWSTESLPQVDEIIRQLAQERNYDLTVLRRIIHCAFQMSEENLGAIFILGQADEILGSADAPVINHYASVVGVHIKTMSNRELINFAKQDGATIIDLAGRFQNCMVLLRPKAKTQAEIGPGKGARHSSAAKISAEFRCLAVTVSQDGPITIYDSGKRLMSL